MHFMIPLSTVCTAPYRCALMNFFLRGHSSVISCRTGENALRGSLENPLRSHSPTNDSTQHLKVLFATSSHNYVVHLYEQCQHPIQTPINYQSTTQYHISQSE